jgi:hypothetical protein
MGTSLLFLPGDPALPTASRTSAARGQGPLTSLQHKLPAAKSKSWGIQTVSFADLYPVGSRLQLRTFLVFAPFYWFFTFAGTFRIW